MHLRHLSGRVYDARNQSTSQCPSDSTLCQFFMCCSSKYIKQKADISSIVMSYEDLCAALPSESSVNFVRYYRKDGNIASCTWEQFAEVAKHVQGKLSYGIKIVAEDRWWVEYYSCGDHYYSEWQVNWIPHEDEVHSIPEIKDLERNW